MLMIIKNSIKQSEIIELLVKTRGGNAEQITRAIYGEASFKKLTQTYELLNKLIKKKYIEYFIYKEGDNQKRFYSLSKRGLIFYQEHYKVIKDKRGTGLFGDLGYFEHKLYKPKQQQIKHLLMTIDAMIDVYLIQKQTNLIIDFAHNLYCATEYIKPDFVIQHGDSKYFVEMDRMNERGIALNKKFQKYNLYLNNTAKDNNQVKGIYFVVPTPRIIKSNQFDSKQQQRYESVINAYLQECEDYKDKIDLCFITTTEFDGALREDVKVDKQYNQKIIEYLRKQPNAEIKLYKDCIYLAELGEKVIEFVVEINYRRTKIWFDLLNLQKRCSISKEVGDIIKFIHYTHVPDITVFTKKSNLIKVIEDKEFLDLFTVTKQIKKAPTIIKIE